ncbi:ABC transporter ATP-binding protein [Insolitispirillum peregrinum]|uniref:Iron(III) transport system ATP-binding protein n=1 Tax=Insolitispirillum peregrinum TaxID=80876 RepID=A0A1N7IQV0_9PROT|nr:ABC transporter ATP-binding protein [Insolitispirillum peregrinum]SIS39459.1 iron(III) transport system ATP-binding protein [Insolitispirillum peregrinum]
MSATPSPSDAGLSLLGLHHVFDGIPVVHDVTVHVAPGEILCLLGPSGCGKTTTLRLIAGLEPPSGGRVVLNGRQLSRPGSIIPPERRGVGFLFQDFALFPHLNVADNVGFGLSKSDPARAHKIQSLLQQVGMASHSMAWPHQLSGGQQQRVALARALAPEPGLMLLDEPFSGLDKRLRDQVRDETLRVLKESNVCTVMVTHDPEEALLMADRIAIMQAGHVVQIGTPTELYDTPATPFVAAFFGDINSMEGQIHGEHVQSPLGRLRPAVIPTGLADGSPVGVVIRPEAISLNPADPDGEAIVRDARPIGRGALVWLEINGTLFKARTFGGPLPAIGAACGFTVDQSHTHAFAKL